MLAWSFNRDGEPLPGIVEQRDKRLGIDSAKLRRERSGLARLARPQTGVDDLKGKFARPTSDIPGVSDPKKGRSSTTAASGASR